MQPQDNLPNTQPEPAVQPMINPTPAPAPASEPTPAPEAPQNITPVTPPETKKSKLPFIIGGVILLVAIIAGVIFFIANQSGGSDKQGGKASESELEKALKSAQPNVFAVNGKVYTYKKGMKVSELSDLYLKNTTGKARQSWGTGTGEKSYEKISDFFDLEIDGDGTYGYLDISAKNEKDESVEVIKMQIYNLSDEKASVGECQIESIRFIVGKAPDAVFSENDIRIAGNIKLNKSTSPKDITNYWGEGITETIGGYVWTNKSEYIYLTITHPDGDKNQDIVDFIGFEDS